MPKPKCPKGYKLNEGTCKIIKPMVGNISSEKSKNPFKMWGSYFGLFLGLVFFIISIENVNLIFGLFLLIGGFLLGYGAEVLDSKIYGRNKFLDYIDLIFVLPVFYGFIATWMNYFFKLYLPMLWFSSQPLFYVLFTFSILGILFMFLRIKKRIKWIRIGIITFVISWGSWVFYQLYNFHL